MSHIPGILTSTIRHRYFVNKRQFDVFHLASHSARVQLGRGPRCQKVPFVELLGQRLQGVVSSGSDIQRVYVSFIEAGTLNYWCSTNNNRPCGGLRGSPCNHLQELVGEAIVQHGIERVVAFLRIPGDPAQLQSARDILRHSGHMAHEAAQRHL